MKCWLFILLLSTSIVSAWADEGAYTELGLGFGKESLSAAAPDWRDDYVQLLHAYSSRQKVSVRLARQARFGLQDNAATLATYQPLGKETTLFVALMKSSQHQFLPRDSLQVQFSRALDAGFGAALGVREARYNNSRVTVAEITAERYFGDQRVALSAYPSRSSLAGNATSYRLSWAHYDERSHVQLALTSDIELDRVTALQPILATRVRGITLYGQQALDAAWALTYALGRSTRAGVAHRQFDVGVRHQFR